MSCPGEPMDIDLPLDELIRRKKEADRAFKLRQKQEQRKRAPADLDSPLDEVIDRRASCGRFPAVLDSPLKEYRSRFFYDPDNPANGTLARIRARLASQARSASSSTPAHSLTSATRERGDTILFGGLPIDVTEMEVKEMLEVQIGPVKSISKNQGGFRVTFVGGEAWRAVRLFHHAILDGEYHLTVTRLSS